MLKKIILAAAICGALGTCTIGASDISSAQEPAREGEVTVIKGKVIETVVPKKNHRKDKRTVEKQEVKTEDKTAAKEEKTLKPAAEKTAGKTEVKKAVPAKAAPAKEAAAAKEEAKKPEETAPAKPRFEDKRIEINLASRLLTLYQGDVGIRMYPIAPGKPDSPTPTGRRTVIDMEKDPTWVDPDNPSVTIPSGPDCPIGYRWIGIGGNYGIHGTNRPSAIGTYASHGCVRMNEADVEDLYNHIVMGIPVDIIYERVVVQEEADHTVVYYIYPDGYGREPLDVATVKQKLAPFGVSACVSDDDVQQAIDASDGNPRYVVKVYDLYVKGQKLDARAFGKDGHVYLPVMAVAKALGIKAEWSPNWNRLRTANGEAPAVLKNRSLLIDAKDAETLFHVSGTLDDHYNYDLN